MRRKELWKKRLYKAAALGMALSMVAGTPMMAMAEVEEPEQITNDVPVSISGETNDVPAPEGTARVELSVVDPSTGAETVIAELPQLTETKMAVSLTDVAPETGEKKAEEKPVAEPEDKTQELSKLQLVDAEVSHPSVEEEESFDYQYKYDSNGELKIAEEFITTDYKTYVGNETGGTESTDKETRQYVSVTPEIVEKEKQTLEYTDTVYMNDEIEPKEFLTLVDKDRNPVIIGEGGDREPIDLGKIPEEGLEETVASIQKEIDEACEAGTLVQVVQRKDGLYEEVEEDQIVYGYVDNGVFVKTDNVNDTAYALGDPGDDDMWKEVTYIYSEKGENGEVKELDPEIIKVLRGEESEKYQVERRYEWNGEIYDEEQIKEVMPGFKAEGMDYTTKSLRPVESGALILEDKSKLTFVSKIDDHTTRFGYTTTCKDGTKIYQETDLYMGYYEEIDGEYYYKAAINGQTSTPMTAYENCYSYHRFYDTGEQLGIVTQKVFEEKKNVIVKVYDAQNNLIWSGDTTAYNNIITQKVAVVAGKIRVKGEDEDVFIDPGTYKVVKATAEVHETNIIKYYSAVEKYEEKEDTLALEEGDYKVHVNFWNNSRICMTNAVMHPLDDGTNILIHLTIFLAEKDGPVQLNKVIVMPKEDFGPEKEATIEIMYTPSYEYTFSENADDNQLRAAVKRSGKQVVLDDAANWAGSIAKDEPEEQIAKETTASNEGSQNVTLKDVLGDADDEIDIEVKIDLGTPQIKTSVAGVIDETETEPETEDETETEPETEDETETEPETEEEPTPAPTPTPAPAPSQTTTTTTAAASSAPAVLGVSREDVEETTTVEATEEPEVLGADRPQTGDMAMPFAWAFTMLGAGAAAILALRKRER
ncbi:MAG: hypothetical protein K5682_01800 [Lachnospiraceae bacterium]|nr:hypothetical protein [Lachnospiraceae bacterium]